MILLSAHEITRQFDVEPVFRDVSFEVRPGDRIGLVGPNGTGKTTLLKILAGLDDPDRGHVDIHPTADVSLLEQETDFPPERTLLEEAREGLKHLYDLQTESTRLAEQIAAERDPQQLDKLQRQFDHLQQELHRLDAYNIDHRVDAVLTGLGFTEEEHHRPLVTFSGGQQSRAILARLLLRSPDVMLLDEPTNHLDIAATEWLEDFLAKSPRAMIVVSHDRYFLDRVTNRIFELFGGRLTEYRGNFSAYWDQREERNKVLARTYEKQQEFIEKTEDFIRRNKYGQKHAQASDREKKLSRVELVDRPREISELPMSFGNSTRTGDWVIDAEEVSKGYGAPLFSEFTLRIERGDRIGIFGPNGSGKSTLLKTLIRELPPDAGVVRHGTGVKIGYFDQQLESLDPELDAIDAIRPPNVPHVEPGPLRSLLARFGIRGDMHYQKVGSMSGGEKNKVALARLAARDVNVLILDEPTNHLDLWARASLENALKQFEGTLLFVSHDRYFLDRVARSVIVMEPESWQHYAGNYSDYILFRKHRAEELRTAGERKAAAETQPARSAAPDRDSAPAARRKRKFPYRKVSDLETDIAEAESLLAKLENDLADPGVHRDGHRARQIAEQYEDVKLQLEQLYAHWEEAVELN